MVTLYLGQVFSQKLLSLRDQHKTSEGSPSDDDSYLGYSVATGEFNGDGDNADVVVGMPRGANLTGKVNFISIFKLFNLIFGLICHDFGLILISHVLSRFYFDCNLIPDFEILFSSVCFIQCQSDRNRITIK